MSQGDLINITRDALTTALLLAAPFLIITAIIGLVVSIIQAATQIQEQSIAFILKIVAVALALFLLSSWLMTTAVDYIKRIFSLISGLS